VSEEYLSVIYDYSDVLEWAHDTKMLSERWFPMALQAGVREASLFFEREAKVHAPHDTGRLEASIGHGPEGIWSEGGAKGQGYWVDVGTNVEYAPYMEFGFTMSKGHVAYIKAAGGFRYVHPFSFLGYHYMKKAGNATDRMIGPTIEKHLSLAAVKAGW
jgi:hypothetical protein